jgi:hypothetical protein
MSDSVKECRAICAAIAITIIMVVAGIAIGCTVTSVRSAHRDEVIKVAAAEAGCNYVHQEMLCVTAAVSPEE